MTDSLSKYGLCIDEMCKIRLVDPLVARQSDKLRSECDKFVENITEFETNTNNFIRIMEGLGQDVEREKMKTIGARNLLRSVAKQRESHKQQMQALILEKSMQLERLRVHFDSLKKIEEQQLETIEHLSAN
ncbi:intraflagellar transport protein 20 homolog B [Venturia canescens]|uniref:intraflagellar transport protein 20 homolog B n=1 Tax=Venturia canescens TaxID=32260 RepID=UPI001C9D2107|nr:intraflagellar transport protein 20 homolog B [Venturia canescens]